MVYRAESTLLKGTRSSTQVALRMLTSSSPEQAKDYASKMLNAKLITKQTGAQGRICNTVRLSVCTGRSLFSDPTI
jgi:hypothetical protein